MDTIKSLIKSHKMIPHPEGGHYVEVYKNKDVSHIYYLLEKGQYSHWHRIKKNETIHFYAGSPLRIYTSKNGEEYEINEIGSKDRFIYSVESNIWQWKTYKQYLVPSVTYPYLLFVQSVTKK